MEDVVSEMRTTKVSLLWSEGGAARGVGGGQSGSLYALLWVRKTCRFGRKSFAQKAFMQSKYRNWDGVVVQFNL